MMSNTKGLEIARRRIEVEAEAKTGFLDLGGLGLAELPDSLFAGNMGHLKRLSLASWNRTDDDSRSFIREMDSYLEDNAAQRLLYTISERGGLDRLEHLECSGTDVKDLAPIVVLQSLQQLDCGMTEVFDLSPLANLSELRVLDCGGSKVVDLNPLAGLKNLRCLDCSNTKIDSLETLPGELEALYCSGAQLRSLEAIRGLVGLKILDLRCAGTTRSRSRIGSNDLCVTYLVSDLHDLGPIENLSKLQSLDISQTDVCELRPLARLLELRFLNFSKTNVSDLTPLSGLSKLQSLDFSETGVCALGPVTGLPGLSTLNFSHTKVVDLGPLVGLPNLESIACFGTDVSDLSPLGGLGKLRNLELGVTKVTDLKPLSQCGSLTNLELTHTLVNDLSPLTSLAALQLLDCSHSDVNDLEPLSELASLQSLYCAHTRIRDLKPLAKLTSLQSLDCCDTSVSKLEPLVGIKSLIELNVCRTKISVVPDSLIFGVLQKLMLQEVPSTAYPEGILSEDDDDCCLERLRAHVRDLGDNEADAMEVQDVRILLLGNGSVGKTQISNRLQKREFEKDSESTHGVMVTDFRLSADALGGVPYDVNLWDFGGQDLYHGTNALFTKSSAIFVVVWSDDMEPEAAPRHMKDGYDSVNHPLAYWLHYVRHHGSETTPVIVCQNKVDGAGQRVAAPLAKEQKAMFTPEQLDVVYCSARENEMGGLREALIRAIRELRRSHGLHRVGKARVAVMDELKRMRREDAVKPPSERQNRVLTHDALVLLCQQACAKTEARITDPSLFLDYLHEIGLVYHQEGVLGGHIVLDQTWALDALYAVFSRELGCAQAIEDAGGLFVPSFIQQSVWDRSRYSEAECKLFLKMMETSNIIFRHQDENLTARAETVYAVPELFRRRDRTKVFGSGLWERAPEAGIYVLRFRFPFLSPVVARLILSTLGSEVGGAAEYWKFGVYFLEAHTGAKALVEAVWDSGTGLYSGEVRVETQSGMAGELILQIQSRLERALHCAGEKEWRLLDEVGNEVQSSDRRGLSEKLRVIRSPEAPPRIYFSYKRGGQSQILTRSLHHALENSGADGRLDERDIREGDTFPQFALEMSQGDFFVLVLSRNFLGSEHCMRELYYTRFWGCHDDDGGFQRKVIPLVMDDSHFPEEGVPSGDFYGWISEVVQFWEAEARKRRDAKSAYAEEIETIALNLTRWLETVWFTFSERDLEGMARTGWQRVVDRVWGRSHNL